MANFKTINVSEDLREKIEQKRLELQKKLSVTLSLAQTIEYLLNQES